ncbi:hypothetical protein SJAG_05629 [Schizosaccharomyces japonicus yFS275]|uniref:Uncharacterized protein n=1 Tax=Schizosaccharomyces japonicus (strain yFS275 / FY16936) TaxID=402676 RepID=T0RSS5_SCHJY|nr:hypothetical protein SJAG_05629 [Schizosaccharomyces japonicus yFS275]EQC52980.1 hypothetical protein SJAG_05629 [Schizosaccharomyces japonicus yFS275]
MVRLTPLARSIFKNRVPYLQRATQASSKPTHLRRPKSKYWAYTLYTAFGASCIMGTVATVKALRKD